MSLIAPNVDAAVTLLAGLWACLIGWFHPVVRGLPAPPRSEGMPDATPPVGLERAIGPLILAMAIIEFVACM